MQEFFNLEINPNSPCDLDRAFSDSLIRNNVYVNSNSKKSLEDNNSSVFLVGFEILFSLAILGVIIGARLYKNYQRDRAFAWLQKVVFFERIFQAPDSCQSIAYKEKVNVILHNK